MHFLDAAVRVDVHVTAVAVAGGIYGNPRAPVVRTFDDQIGRGGVGDVEGLGRKAAAVEVALHMSSPPRSANATKALEAQVARIWRVIKETL